MKHIFSKFVFRLVCGDMTGIYVHIPYCKRRCLYCDFYAEGAARADWHNYIDAVLRDAVNSSFKSDSGHTLYIGGGTPSLIPDDEFLRLAKGLRDTFGDSCEFTIEVNPDDVTSAKVDTWHRGGVTRISMGVQSLIDSELKVIGRRHDARTAVAAFHLLTDRFDNISLDLMFGLPGQTIDSLRATVEEFINLNPQHISAYSLTFEERSALTRLKQMGTISEIDDDTSFEMFDMISDLLGLAGFKQYETSNYARQGFESKHNSLYWNASPYIGLGAGAHGYDGLNTRYQYIADVKKYIAGKDHLIKEILSPNDLREEMIMTRLRCCEGLSLQEFEIKFGQHALRQLLRKTNRYVLSGHICRDSNRIRLSRAGLFIADEIISYLF